MINKKRLSHRNGKALYFLANDRRPLTADLFISAFFDRFFIVFVLPQHPPGKGGEKDDDENFIRGQMIVRPFQCAEAFVEKTSNAVPEA